MEYRTFILNKDFNIKKVSKFFTFIDNLPQYSNVRIILASSGGHNSVGEVLASYILSAFAAKNISNLDVYVVEECSSSAIDFLYSIRNLANIFIGSGVVSVLHKCLFAGGNDQTTKSEMKFQNDFLAKDDKETLKRYSKYLDPVQLEDYNMGLDVYLTNAQLLKILKAKTIL